MFLLLSTWYDKIFAKNYWQKIKIKRNQVLRAPSSVGRYNSMRADEGINRWSLRPRKKKMCVP